jgi:hypothetical protein
MSPNALKRFNLGEYRWKSSDTACFVARIDG